MAGQSLEELAAENATAEEELEQNTDAVLNEPLEEAGEETSEEAGEAAASEPGEADEIELEAWQLTEEQTSDSNDDAGFAQVRRKYKAKLNDAKDENADLRAQLATLSAQVNGTAQPAQQPAVNNPAPLGAMPTLESCDYDEVAHGAAVAGWVDSKINATVNASAHTQVKTQAQTAAANVLAKNLDDHYDRAGTLAQESNISAEVYQAADLAVRQTFESAVPGQGDIIADQVISMMGEGSEKVMYFLGRNPKARSKLSQVLSEDPSGLKAAMYLGQLKTDVASPKKRKTSAPRPATNLDSGDQTSDPGAALKKQYDKADGVQARMDIKFKAKDQGINTKKW